MFLWQVSHEALVLLCKKSAGELFIVALYRPLWQTEQGSVMPVWSITDNLKLAWSTWQASQALIVRIWFRGFGRATMVRPAVWHPAQSFGVPLKVPPV